MLVAAVQLTSRADTKKNLAVAADLMLRAVRQGAELVALPEHFSLMGTRTELLKQARPHGEGPAFDAMRGFASQHKVFVLAGTIPVVPEGRSQEDKLLLNRSVLFGPRGETLGLYDKIHLFDTEIADARSYRESETFRAGSEIVTADTPFGRAGFAICYDLRFPELFRALSLRGARLVFVPSAFTMYTGKDHWLPLLRARAIENQVYVAAPAQFGKHAEHKSSYGKSCIIDPWGNIIALAPDCETVVTADVDFKFLTKVRKELPVLKHYRKDLFPLP